MMLEKPNILDEDIITHIIDNYGLYTARLAFLPIGADVNTAVYRLETQGNVYFLKLRRGAFEEITVTVPLYLRSLGLNNIIPPLQTRDGGWWAHLGDYTSILYPFITGQDGYTTSLTDSQWQEFGAALNQIHTTHLPQFSRGEVR